MHRFVQYHFASETDNGEREGKRVPPYAVSRIIAVIGLGLMLSLPPQTDARSAETPADADYVSNRLQEILEFEKTGTVVPWKNPATKNQGTIRIERTYYQNPKLPCRDYVRSQVMRDGKTMTILGTGCRVGDERWFLEERPPQIEDPAAAEKETAKKPSAKKESASRPTEPKSPDKKAAPPESEPPKEAEAAVEKK